MATSKSQINEATNEKMVSTSEAGHAKNVANFEHLVSYCTGYGTTYNPGNDAIKVDALTPLLTSANSSINAVNAVLPAHTNAISARDIAFKPLSKLITRLINALKSSGAAQQYIGNALSLVRKIQGRRASRKFTEEEKKALVAEGKEQYQISASQLSFDNRLDNFDKLIKLLASIPEYAPNEADLKVTALTTLFTDLKAKNKAVIDATTPLSNARIARNEILYKETTGLVDVALAVKSYVKSLFGANSSQFRQISKLKFRRYKR